MKHTFGNYPPLLQHPNFCPRFDWRINTKR